MRTPVVTWQGGRLQKEVMSELSEDEVRAFAIQGVYDCVMGSLVGGIGSTWGPR